MRRTEIMKGSLIITTYNRPDALELVLKSALQQSKLPDEIIVADDGSNKDTRKLTEKIGKLSPVPLLHSWQEDKGFRAASSRNRAIALSKNDYIVLIDGDMILHPDFFKDHISSAKNNLFIQGSRVLMSRKKSKRVLSKKKANVSPFTFGLKNRTNSIRNVLLSMIFSSYKDTLKGIKTCNMSFFREDCIKVNGFNEDFTGWGREDSEFVARLYNNGIHRKNLKFMAISYHIWHQENSREKLSCNQELLEKTIQNRAMKCLNGIDKYLNR